MKRSKYEIVDGYIKRVIAESCEAEERENDVTYRFCIIEDNVVMKLNSKYKKVIKRIEYRLRNNLPKNFGLKYNKDFDIFMGTDEASSIDICYSIDVFSKNPFATIRAKKSKAHLLPKFVRDVSNINHHVYKVYKLNDGKPPTTWEKYLKDYEQIYGKPLKSIAIWK